MIWWAGCDRRLHAGSVGIDQVECVGCFDAVTKRTLVGHRRRWWLSCVRGWRRDTGRASVRFRVGLISLSRSGVQYWLDRWTNG